MNPYNLQSVKVLQLHKYDLLFPVLPVDICKWHGFFIANCLVIKHNSVGMKLTAVEIPTCGPPIIRTGALDRISNIDSGLIFCVV
jgi:hypothetical protein